MSLENSCGVLAQHNHQRKQHAYIPSHTEQGRCAECPLVLGKADGRWRYHNEEMWKRTVEKEMKACDLTWKPYVPPRAKLSTSGATHHYLPNSPPVAPLTISCQTLHQWRHSPVHHCHNLHLMCRFCSSLFHLINSQFWLRNLSIPIPYNCGQHLY